MKSIISAIVCLLICGSIWADEPKKVAVDVKVVPKVGVLTPHPRPRPGNYYWRHPTYGYGYWYYPAPVQAAPANYYIDEYGRVVPNGYAYDGNGQLVPIPAAPVVQPPVYQYPYYGDYWRYGRYGRWGGWGWR